MYDLIEYSENYPWVYGYLWVYYSDQLVLDNNGDSIDFSINGDTRLSVMYRKGNDGEKKYRNTEIWVLLKYLSNFWRIVDISLINGVNIALQYLVVLIIKYQNLQ